jgi:aminoglycoside phosphotransferase (APT) family kinase protein
MAGNFSDEKSGWRVPNDVRVPSVSDVQRMLSPWLGSRRVLGVELLPGGLANRNCRVRLGGSLAAVVLRLYGRDGAACAKEVALLELVRRDVPVPRVLYAEPSAREGTPPFAVLEVVDGVSLRDLKQTGDLGAIGEAAYDAGRVLARLVAHRFPSPGLLTPALTVDASFIDGPITTAALITLFTESPTFRRRVDVPLRDRLLHVAREWDEHPAAPDAAATLVHGDFNAPNVFVRQHEGRWSVAAILDWEYAFAGPVHCDIGNFLRYERALFPRFEPFFSRGCQDGGLDLRGDWLAAARMADLPALCELLTRESMPDNAVREVHELVTTTVDARGKAIASARIL